MPTIEVIEQLAKRRGLFWPSSEIYGGASGFYDYGPIGTAIKRNLENLWRKYFLSLSDNFFEVETTNIMPEKVFQASGHVSSFVDPIAKCKKCGAAHRADHIVEEFLKESFEGMTPMELTELIKKHKIRCSKCKGELEEVAVMNMMFSLDIGGGKAYLRPETAQGPFVNFMQNFEVLRKKLPLGLAVVGRAYRNEISPRQLLSRMREFTQAELQIFFDPSGIDDHEKWSEVAKYKLVLFPIANKKLTEITCDDAVKKLKMPKFYVYHLAKAQQFYLERLGIPKENFRFRELSEEERAFYNKLHWDIELNVEALGGFKEVGGVHYRTDHDLAGHAKVSGKSQEVFVDNKRFTPHVIELSFGVDRLVMSLVDVFYTQDKDRTLLKLPPAVAPFTAAIFPLVSKDGIDKKAMEIYDQLKRKFKVLYDDGGSIGRRYARVDEIGVPFAITVDYDTLKDKAVTVRSRDTTKQERVKISDLENKFNLVNWQVFRF